MSLCSLTILSILPMLVLTLWIPSPSRCMFWSRDTDGPSQHRVTCIYCSMVCGREVGLSPGIHQYLQCFSCDSWRYYSCSCYSRQLILSVAWTLHMCKGCVNKLQLAYPRLIYLHSLSLLHENVTCPYWNQISHQDTFTGMLYVTCCGREYHYVHTYASTNTHIHSHTYTGIHKHIYTYTHTYTCTYIHTQTHLIKVRFLNLLVMMPVSTSI